MPGRILIVEDSAVNRLVLRSRLNQAYYDVIEAETGEQALAAVAQMEPDLILLDIMLPGMDGFEVCRTLKSSAETLHIPIVMLTALGGWEDRMQGLHAGADDFLTKPFEEVALMSRVASLIRIKMMVDELALRDATANGADAADLIAIATATSFRDSRILYVSGNAAQAASVVRSVEVAVGARSDVVSGVSEALAAIEFTEYDALVIDEVLADGDPLRLGAVVRARPETRQAATILIVGQGNVAMAAKALELGFSDYVTGVADTIELTARIRLQLRRKKYSDRLRENMRTRMLEAVTDPLTGLYNRRYASNHLNAMVNKMAAKGAALAVLVLDLDRFKEVNDTHGHAGGDLVLTELANRLRENVRNIDLVARMGGEEFMVALPDVTVDTAAEIAERIRAAVAAPAFAVSDSGAQAQVTVSIGFAVAHEGESAASVIARADAALFLAKAGGRNRVSVGAAA